MVCNVVKNVNGVAFVCIRGNSKLTEDDQRKINEILKNLAKELENDSNKEQSDVAEN